MPARKFRLGGKSYSLTPEDVRDRLRGLMPKALDKYSVEVHGRPYPPKQVLSAVLKLPVSNFTTIDANRILTALGFVVADANQEGSMPVKTESERLFEAVLNARRLTDFHFEQCFEGTSRRPDFTVLFEGNEILFEVKEFQPAAGDFQLLPDACDPYRPIREKIEAARKKFRDLEKHCCNLVVYDCGKPLVFLETEFIYAAMLGDLAIEVPYDSEECRFAVERAGSRFSARGKMRRDRGALRVDVQNRSVSSIIVLDRLKIGYRRFSTELARQELKLGRRPDRHEFVQLLERARGTERDPSLMQLRVIIHENPYARIPLPGAMFRGPYDERYGCTEDGKIQRLFAGPEILGLEAKGKLLKLERIGAFDSSREERWLAEHRAEYAGQWVALDGDRLIAHGPDAGAVYEAARKSGVELPLVEMVEGPDQLPFGGW